MAKLSGWRGKRPHPYVAQPRTQATDSLEERSDPIIGPRAAGAPFQRDLHGDTPFLRLEQRHTQTAVPKVIGDPVDAPASRHRCDMGFEHIPQPPGRQVGPPEICLPQRGTVPRVGMERVGRGRPNTNVRVHPGKPAVRIRIS